MSLVRIVPEKGPSKPTPPYLPFKTFSNTIAGWSATDLPGRIDRTLFRSLSGAMQSWLISTLRYFDLIDADGHPTDRLRRLVKANDAERPKVYLEMVRGGYPFVFAGNLDLATASFGQVQDRFKETGLQGDTVRKAIGLFTALAREAGMKMSPYLKMARRSAPSSPRRRAISKAQTPTPRVVGATATMTVSKTPFEILYGILDPDKMDDTEQNAVWTLLRYIKKQGG